MRLFIAVWPPAEVVGRLRALERPVVDGVRWTTPQQWHVTARFLGTVDDPEAVSAGLRSSPLPAGVATAGPASECATATVLWLPVLGLEALAAAVNEATAGIGQRATGPFRGHLTLARAGRAAGRGVLRRMPSLAFSARWAVREVTLVASTLGGTGSRYDVVDRIALG